MVQRTLAVLAFMLVCNVCFSQKYFDLFSSNLSKSQYDRFSVSFGAAFGWLGTGNYSSPSDCLNCFDYSRDSKLKKEKLDSLVRTYKESGFGKLYSGIYIPNGKHFVSDKVKAAPYIIKTLYRIEGTKPIALQQIKMTFYDRTNLQPGVLDVEIVNEKSMQQYDPKIVMAAYKNKLKEDAKETPPPIEH